MSKDFNLTKPTDNKKPTQRDLENADIITMSAITTQLSMYYVERVRELGAEYYSLNLKGAGNKYLKELIKTEEKVYDKLYSIEEKITIKQTDTVQEGIKFLKQCGFVGFVLANRFNKAYNYDPKRVMGIVDKIIKDHE